MGKVVSAVFAVAVLAVLAMVASSVVRTVTGGSAASVARVFPPVHTYQGLNAGFVIGRPCHNVGFELYGAPGDPSFFSNTCD